MASFFSAESLGKLGCSTVGISCAIQRFSKSVSRTEAMCFNLLRLALAPRSMRCKMRVLIPAIGTSCSCVSLVSRRSFPTHGSHSDTQSKSARGRTARRGMAISQSSCATRAFTTPASILTVRYSGPTHSIRRMGEEG